MPKPFILTMDKISPHKDILKTREHFEILDGLRGIAALAIVIFHFMEWVYPQYSQNFIGYGFLAVDFFSSAYWDLSSGMPMTTACNKWESWSFLNQGSYDYILWLFWGQY